MINSTKVLALAFVVLVGTAAAASPRADIAAAFQKRRAGDAVQDQAEKVSTVALLQEDTKPSVGQSILSAVVNTLTGAPGGIDLNVLQTLFRREKSSSIGQIIKSDGFKRLNINFQMQASRGVSDTLLMQMLDDPGMLGLTPSRFPKTLLSEASLATILDTFRLLVADGAAGSSWNGVFIRFQNNKGEFTFVVLGLRRVAPHAWDPPYKARYDFQYGITSGDFEPAPDFMVVHHSKSSFFSSKSWDELVPMERGVTPEMLDGLMVQVLPKIVHVMAAMSNSLSELAGGNAPGLLPQSANLIDGIRSFFADESDSDSSDDSSLDSDFDADEDQDVANSFDSVVAHDSSSAQVETPSFWTPWVPSVRTEDTSGLSEDMLEDILEHHEQNVFATIRSALYATAAAAAGTPIALDWRQLRMETIHSGAKKAVVGANFNAVVRELNQLLPGSQKMGCSTLLTPRVCAADIAGRVLSEEDKKRIARFTVDAALLQYKVFDFEVRSDANALLAHVHIYAERTAANKVTLDLAVVTVAAQGPKAISRTTTRRCRRKCPIFCKRKCKTTKHDLARGYTAGELNTLMEKMHAHGLAELRRLPGHNGLLELA